MNHYQRICFFTYWGHPFCFWVSPPLEVQISPPKPHPTLWLFLGAWESINQNWWTKFGIFSFAYNLLNIDKLTNKVRFSVRELQMNFQQRDIWMLRCILTLSYFLLQYVRMMSKWSFSIQTGRISINGEDNEAMRNSKILSEVKIPRVPKSSHSFLRPLWFKAWS